ncbi:Ca-activated chloride channel family protein [Nocardioides scoriae]|uniref:Ca-activated chloride channel family protein n=1 Tax=Nocardioides scoriae TaxID=642780 RepID=A0A1H1Y1F9_9ACTN|nr:VWA domain-containing protein [Nocardioides scoriae]SDT15318.1 Ca-activated chloride channel family protein [Nocardioides scoriae]
MSFLSPWWLLLLLPVAALAVLYVVQQRRRSAYAVRFASLPMLERLVPRRPRWRRHLPASLLLLSFVLLALAAGRPEAEVRVPRERATVVVAVDVSLSMEATDVEPNRLDAASRAAVRFVEGLPEGFDVGVVTFAGQTTVAAPPSQERQPAIDALENLTLATRTAIGEGVFTSLDQVAATARREGGEPVPAHVVLLSDGTNTVGRTPDQAARAAVEAGVPVSTIAYGTPEGTVVSQGQVVGVPVDEATLAALADTSGGTAYTARSSDELDEVYDDIRSSIGLRTEEREITPYLSALALLLGLGAAVLSLRWSARLP